MDKILELDRANLTMLVEPGVTTLASRRRRQRPRACFIRPIPAR